MTDERPPDPAAEKALDDLAAAVGRAVDTIAALPDPATAYGYARKLVHLLKDAVDVAGRLHAQAAGRIHKAESLSLAGLAKRLGVSKARADQLVNAAKKEEPK